MPRSARIYVGNLSSRAHERDLDDMFYKCGKIRAIEVKRGGFGFVEFFDDRDASDAVRDYDGADLLGRRIRVELSIGRTNSRRGNKVFKVEVTGLDPKTTWKSLKDWARKYVEVNFTKIEGGRGVMEFASADDVRRAIRELDNSKLDGATVRVREVVARSRSRSPRRDQSPRRGESPLRDQSPRRDRSRSPRRSRSRSRSRSPVRSGSRSPVRSRSPLARRSPSPRREESPLRGDSDLTNDTPFSGDDLGAPLN